MRMVHRSREIAHRDPFGAVPLDTEIRLALEVLQEGTAVNGVYLAYAYGRGQFRTGRQAMEQRADNLWDCRLRVPGAPVLLYYWFEVETGGEIRYLVCDRDKADGSGKPSETRPDFHSHERFSHYAFQITVYDDAFETPEWLRGAVIYQVFPDRFARSPERMPTEEAVMADRPERIFHANWEEDVDWMGRPDTGYIACDFFGGSLKGIEEHLDHIAAMGADVIYLNPVFEARSNHRYDTADYTRVDPLLGTEEDLVSLCATARVRGIHVVLDGVFSHTGADSVYFNRLYRYPGAGAWQEAMGERRSPYFFWYSIRGDGDSIQYDSWWGFPELPTINKDDLSYRAFILGESGILRRWIRAGISGWRLDVSDELPDSFLREIRRTVKREDPEAAVIGEVWEDASNKISYGSFRDFAFGATHDSVMGYPFRNALLNWLSRRSTAPEMVNALETIRENYPPVFFHCVMNLIGSHDVPRALTVLSGHPDPGDRDSQAAVHLSTEERERGLRLLRLAVVFQAVFPGAPSLYYGDETGMEGFRDPFNRRTFPWGHVDADLVEHFSKVFSWRKRYPVLKTGACDFRAEGLDVVAIRRYLVDGRDAFGRTVDGSSQIEAWINRSGEERQIATPDGAIRLGPWEAMAAADGERIL